MTGDPKAILRDEKSDAADIRLNGVDYTGSVALTVGGMKQLRPLRMFQIAQQQQHRHERLYAGACVPLHGTGCGRHQCGQRG